MKISWNTHKISGDVTLQLTTDAPWHIGDECNKAETMHHQMNWSTISVYPVDRQFCIGWHALHLHKTAASGPIVRWHSKSLTHHEKLYIFRTTSVHHVKMQRTWKPNETAWKPQQSGLNHTCGCTSLPQKIDHPVAKLSLLQPEMGDTVADVFGTSRQSFQILVIIIIIKDWHSMNMKVIHMIIAWCFHGKSANISTSRFPRAGNWRNNFQWRWLEETIDSL